MADITTAITARLIATSAVTDLVAARIGPWQAMQAEALPYVTYQQIDGDHQHNMSGGSALEHATLQLNCVASTYAGARALANAVREALAGYRGTSDGVVIQSCLIVADRDDPQPPTPGLEKPSHYSRQLDASIWATETIPA